jgi:hypothetical protein
MRRAILLAVSLSTIAQAAEPIFEAIRKDDTKPFRRCYAPEPTPTLATISTLRRSCTATLYASEECMKLLLDKGANVNAAAKGGSTPADVGDRRGKQGAPAAGARRRPQPQKQAGPSPRSTWPLRREGGEAAARLLAVPGQDLRTIAEQGAGKDEAPLFRGGPEVPAEIRAHGFEPLRIQEIRHRAYVLRYVSGRRRDGGPASRCGRRSSQTGAIRNLATASRRPGCLFQEPGGVTRLIEKGAAVNAKGSSGHTALMLAAAADRPSKAVVELLLSRGADPNLTDNEGYTALDWALLQGENEITNLLRQSGAKPGAPKSAPGPRSKPQPAREAVAQAIAQLQPIGPKFFAKTGCISCHNQSLPAMAFTAVRAKGLALDETLAAHPTKATVSTWSPGRENYQQGIGSVGGWIANVSYGLAGMAGEGAPGSPLTDAIALCLARCQRPDGSWNITDVRPPIGLGTHQVDRPRPARIRSLHASGPQGRMDGPRGSGDGLVTKG